MRLRHRRQLLCQVEPAGPARRMIDLCALGRRRFGAHITDGSGTSGWSKIAYERHRGLRLESRPAQAEFLTELLSTISISQRSFVSVGAKIMHLSNQGLLVIIIVGIVAGWLAGRVMEGGGFGLIGDLLVGLVGAFIGDWLLPRLGIHLGVGIVALILKRLYWGRCPFVDPAVGWRRLGPQTALGRALLGGGSVSYVGRMLR